MKIFFPIPLQEQMSLIIYWSLFEVFVRSHCSYMHVLSFTLKQTKEADEFNQMKQEDEDLGKSYLET